MTLQQDCIDAINNRTIVALGQVGGGAELVVPRMLVTNGVEIEFWYQTIEDDGAGNLWLPPVFGYRRVDLGFPFIATELAWPQQLCPIDPGIPTVGFNIICVQPGP